VPVPSRVKLPLAFVTVIVPPPVRVCTVPELVIVPVTLKVMLLFDARVVPLVTFILTAVALTGCPFNSSVAAAPLLSKVSRESVPGVTDVVPEAVLLIIAGDLSLAAMRFGVVITSCPVPVLTVALSPNAPPKVMLFVVALSATNEIVELLAEVS
jgi:hypothetical protein